MAFIDVASIHQEDQKLKERGVYGIAGFLRISKELRILWSAPYFSRLWCVFELAAYQKVNPEGKLTFKPLFLEKAVGWLLLSLHVFGWLAAYAQDAYFHEGGNGVVPLVSISLPIPYIITSFLLRTNFRDKHVLFAQLDTFNLNDLKCAKQFDQDFILAAIENWYGSRSAFTEFLKGDVKLKVVKAMSETKLPKEYLLLLLTPILSLSMEFFLAQWKGGAPAGVLLSYVVGILIGLDVFWIGGCLLLMVYLCDRFAPRRCGYLDHLQTLLIAALITMLIVLGNQIATMCSTSTPSPMAAFLFAASALVFLAGALLLDSSLRSCASRAQAADKNMRQVKDDVEGALSVIQ